MNRLERNAWIELIIVAVSTLVSAGIFAFFVASNTSGIEYIVIFIVVGSVCGVCFGRIAQKSESKYDEREKEIRSKAFFCAVASVVLYLFLMCLVPFFLIGGKGSIGVYFLPIILWSSFFIAQVVQSSVILFQCAKEDTDE